MKRIIGAAALLMAIATGGNATTVYSGEGVFDVHQKLVAESYAGYVLKLQFTAPFAVDCSAGIGCDYQSNGHLLVVDDAAACDGWCGTEIGSFFLDHYTKYVEMTVDANDYLGKYFVLHFNGRDPAKLAWNYAPGEVAPAPVPLPAAGLLLGGALLGFAGIAKRRKKHAA